jgi:dihydroorotate dehydrogenase (NAD+) catalytic subunit
VTASPIPLFDTTFQNPILLAAGTAGFGRELREVMDLDALGGIVTKSVSPEPRRGNPAPRVAEFPGGMLNSVGLANPGVDAVRATELPWLADHLRHARVLVSVVGATVTDYALVIARLTDQPIVTAFELNVSCPNTERGGEHFGANEAVLRDLVARCRAASTRPLVVKLAPTLGDVARAACVAADAGADGIAVVNTIPGILYRRGRARLGAANGGVSGPLLLPVGVLAARRVALATRLPVIGVGGIRTIDDVRQYLEAGAALVAIGTAGLAAPRLPPRLARAWSRG